MLTPVHVSRISLALGLARNALAGIYYQSGVGRHRNRVALGVGRGQFISLVVHCFHHEAVQAAGCWPPDVSPIHLEHAAVARALEAEVDVRPIVQASQMCADLVEGQYALIQVDQPESAGRTGNGGTLPGRQRVVGSTQIEQPAELPLAEAGKGEEQT